MAMEQFLNTGFNEGVSCKSFGPMIDAPETSQAGGFECNICLDTVQEPVVTLCGHLYCWPCIYRWIISFPRNRDEETPRCPVCKTEVSESTLIPLYGRGQSKHPSKNEVNLIPERPSTRFNHLRWSRRPETMPHAAGNYYQTANSMLDHPIIGMFGEMVCARLFGNSETTMYTYANSYSNPRQRRHMMQVDRSMSRVCFFLWCCALLCLLLF